MKDREILARHQMAVARDFAEFLRERGRELADPVPGNHHLKQPDAVCPLPGGGLLGIEVTDAYESAQRAKELWDVPRGKAEPPVSFNAGREELRRRAVFRPFPHLGSLLAEVQRVILKHAKNEYCVPTYLVACLPALPYTGEDAAELVSGVHLPSDSPLLAAYLRLPENFSGRPLFFEIPRKD